MLAMVCNEHQNDWDVHLPYVEYAYNNSVSAVCFRETPFTALQQGDINDLLRVSVPVQINRVIIILASAFFSSLTIADRMEFSNLRNNP